MTDEEFWADMAEIEAAGDPLTAIQQAVDEMIDRAVAPREDEPPSCAFHSP